MTDKEITKALECCNQPVGSGACNKCPINYQRQKRLAKDEQSCTNLMICNALDLINRQKAGIEELQTDGETLAISLLNAKKEIERKDRQIEELVSFQRFCENKAITEFAEIFTEKMITLFYLEYSQAESIRRTARQIAKELKKGGE